MSVSVIIPVYNEEGVIETCLQSLSKQTAQIREIVVVDDGSRDNSMRNVQRARQTLNMQNITPIAQPHKGPGAARNLGVRNATGDILVFVDADMTFAEDCIEKLIQPIRNGETIGTFTKDERVSNWGNVWARSWNWNEGWPPKRRIPSDFPNTAMVFRAITRVAFARAGGFNENTGYTDDWSIARKLGVKSTGVSDATIYHDNPSSLGEVFRDARWIGRNEFLRQNVSSIIRFSLPCSLLAGFIRAVRYREVAFPLFKIVYDFGIWESVLESFFVRRTAK